MDHSRIPSRGRQSFEHWPGVMGELEVVKHVLGSYSSCVCCSLLRVSKFGDGFDFGSCFFAGHSCWGLVVTFSLVPGGFRAPSIHSRGG